MNLKEKKNRIIARGEFSDHCHVIVGKATVERTDEGVFINIEDSNSVMRHLLESKWMKGIEKWTGEHGDIELNCRGDVRHGDVLLKKIGKRRYKYIQQIEFDPFEEIIREVMD